MFSYTGLTANQAIAIRERHNVYMLQSGRISLSGCKFEYPTPFDLYDTSKLISITVNTMNACYVAKAIDDVVRTVV